MVPIVAQCNITLVIPPGFKGLTNGKFVQEFKPGIPVMVPEKIAEYYTSNWSNKFRYANGEMEEFHEPQTSSKIEEEFQPVQWIEDNYENIEAVKELDRSKKLAVAKVLKLTGVHKQTNERVDNRIIHDIKTKTEQQKKLEGG